MDLDRTPEEIARAAGDAIRTLNHRTQAHSTFTYPSEIQSTAVGLSAVLLGLPQTLDQLHHGIDAVSSTQHLYAYDDSNVDDITDRAKTELVEAVGHIREASQALQQVVNLLAYVGAIIPDDEPAETV
ncbi:hypothetical protein [Streptomyces sp. WAC08241]|uniref:hypothetical protein n=1 Tax=Streptomyces sp. WAC08241 TaxID=2487421 RepID=UPI000F795F16|nr:hypothetical protein [Streptomyces sp. WAC08241]RSS37452.1 hypothetical protein EF906_23035 [Streptomyces sp. WAC08241]